MKTGLLLQSEIRFKPPTIEMLAKEAGIEPSVLDLLRKLGVTSEADLRSKQGRLLTRVRGFLGFGMSFRSTTACLTA